MAALLVAAGATVLWACTTPVYRYAMYNWHPMPYAVFYLHQGDAPGESEQRVNERLEALSSDPDAMANLWFSSVDVSQPEHITTLPPEVAELVKDRPADSPPEYVVLSPPPTPAIVYRGALTEDDVEPMLTSPKRRELADILAAGKAGVLVLLSGEDEALTGAAEVQIRGVIEKAAAGGLSGPDNLLPGLPEALQPETLDVGLMTVDRSDPAEAWLVRTLLNVRPADRDHSGPMIFGVYGRGRASEPLVGERVNLEKIEALVEFMSGACSCEVQALNPGKNLLVQWDWNASATAMAEAFGQEEGNENLLPQESLFPDIAIVDVAASVSQPTDPAATDVEGETTSDTVASSDVGADASSTAEQAQSGGEAGQTAGTVGTVNEANEFSTPRVAASTEAAPTAADVQPPGAESGAGSRVTGRVGLWIALGSGVAVTLLAVLSVIVLRSRS
ncbi:MAG: hypothetical protein WDZ59_13000 [Pirellulales bacterium]